MAVRLCPDAFRRLLALAACGAALLVPAQLGQWVALGMGAAVGALCCPALTLSGLRFPLAHRAASVALGLFLSVVAASLLAGWAWPGSGAAFLGAFACTGALVFGGGHVVLPLLHDALVASRVHRRRPFPVGLRLGAGASRSPVRLRGVLGCGGAPAGGTVAMGVAAMLALFLPGLLLAVAGAGYATSLARMPRAGAALAGLNAAVVGLLAAALYNPVWTSAQPDLANGLTLVVAFAGLQSGKLPAWAVAVGCVAVSVMRML